MSKVIPFRGAREAVRSSLLSEIEDQWPTWSDDTRMAFIDMAKAAASASKARTAFDAAKSRFVAVARSEDDD